MENMDQTNVLNEAFICWSRDAYNFENIELENSEAAEVANNNKRAIDNKTVSSQTQAKPSSNEIHVNAQDAAASENIIELLKIKIKSKKEYQKIERLLNITDNGEALVNYVNSKIITTNLKEYIKNMMVLCFSKDFFLDYINFGNQDYEIFFKNSNLLEYFKVCIQIKFAQTLQKETSLEEIFKSVIRTFKGTVRKNERSWNRI